jgi:hypothetical protein
MLRIECFDVEVLPNFFSITFVDLADYLKAFEDCVNDKGKKIPLIQKLTVGVIKDRLSRIKNKKFYITATDDSQLFSMVDYIYKFAVDSNGFPARTDLYGYNSKSYDNLMVAAFLMYFNQFDTTKELITKLYQTSKRIIELQNDKEAGKNDFFLRSLNKFKLPFVGVDVMKIFALNKAGSYNDSQTGEKKYIPKGLKQTSINLQWYELLEYELPPINEKEAEYYRKDVKYKGYSLEELNNTIDKWDRYILDEYIPDMLHYNLNDVFIVAEIVRLKPDEIKSRYAVSASYEVDVLNSSRSNMADVLFQKFYTKFSGIPYDRWKDGRTERKAMSIGKIIFDCVRFKNPQLQELLAKLRKTVIYRVNKDSLQEEIVIGKTVYNLATGGLHSKDIPMEIWSTTEWNGVYRSSTGEIIDKSAIGNTRKFTIKHADVSSYYPSIMAFYGVAPAHMIKSAFRNLIQWMKDTRVAVKHSDEAVVDGIPRDVLALVLKIVINSIYGKFGFENGPLYDRLATLQVTINGQLMLLMLCEELEANGIPIISANTDGLMVKVYEDKEEDFNRIVDWWQKTTGMSMDADVLHCLIARDVNNYIAQFRVKDKKTGKLKLEDELKGTFNPLMYLNDLQKGYSIPIVSKAVYDYFINHVPVMDTLKAATNILDFCMTQNVGKNFHIIQRRVINNEVVDEVYQRYVRFYVANNGHVLMKVHNISGQKERFAAGTVVQICNSLDDTPIELRNIDYGYYYRECMKIIEPVKLGISPKGKGKTRVKKYAGMYNKLFDDDETD